MSQALAKRAFTVSEYNRMAEVGILKQTDRVELIDGEIIQMSPIGSRHAACINRLNTILHQEAKENFIISVQNPLIVDDYCEPEPDLALLRLRPDFYEHGHPQSGDVLLVIEVADSTVDFDRTVKIPIYARNGIPLTLLVNLPSEVVELHADPAGPRYRLVKNFARGQSVSLPTKPEITFRVNDILG
jgi:Uma2 family endonuclease